jgi:predicted esterase
VVAAALSFGTAAAAEDGPGVPEALRKALGDYLAAPPSREGGALKRLLGAAGKDLATAAEAIRTHPPLSKAKPGTRHGLTVESGGHAWEYSIRLPEGYDGKRLFPALVLPDHGSVGPEAGIGFWDGAEGVEEYVLFRPVILRHQEDRKRFPDQQFFARDEAIAAVMRDALSHLRLHYAVDPERLSMTGLSQAGYYTWYLAVSFPDQFAAIVPESAGGTAVVAAVRPLARNLASMHVRILHAEGDEVTPYAHAKAMHEALLEAGAPVELITYRDADYPGKPFPKRHPGPHDKRILNVLPWARLHARTVPTSFTRVLRYRQQGVEGRFRIPPPSKPTEPLTVTCEAKEGRLSTDGKGVVYLASPEEVLSGRALEVGGKGILPIANLELLFTSFKEWGDRGRLFAAEVPLRGGR